MLIVIKTQNVYCTRHQCYEGLPIVCLSNRESGIHYTVTRALDGIIVLKIHIEKNSST